jgi:hypothetical protein
MRQLIPAALLVVMAACASAPPDTTAIIPFVALDSMIVAPISPDAPRIDQLVLSDSVVAMTARRETCATVDQTLQSWAEGASAFNGAVALGIHAQRSGAAARALHTVADAGVIASAAAAGLFALNELDKAPPRDFGSVKVALGVGALLKLLDVTIWKREAEDARIAFDAAKKISELAPGATNMPERILALRGRCRDAAFDVRVRDLRAQQVALVSDFVDLVDRIPARYIRYNRNLFAYRQRLRWYEARTDISSE